MNLDGLMLERAEGLHGGADMGSARARAINEAPAREHHG